MNGLYGTVRCHQITYHHLATLLLKNFNTDSRVNSLPSLLGLRTINKSGRSAHFVHDDSVINAAAITTIAAMNFIEESLVVLWNYAAELSRIDVTVEIRRYHQLPWGKFR